MGNRKAPSGPCLGTDRAGLGSADRKTPLGDGGTRFGAEEAAAGGGFPLEATRTAVFAVLMRRPVRSGGSGNFGGSPNQDTGSTVVESLRGQPELPALLRLSSSHRPGTGPIDVQPGSVEGRVREVGGVWRNSTRMAAAPG